MERNEVSERLNGVLVSELGLDAAKIKDDAHFERTLMWTVLASSSC